MDWVSRRGSCALAVTLTPAIATAADWSIQSAAQLYAVSESNPQLLADQKHNTQSGVADLSVDVMRGTELLDLDLSADASAHRYGGDVGLDRDDQQIALAMAHRGETYTLRGNASLKRDTTLTSELGTTGITEFNQRHRARALSVAPQWQLNERLSTGLTLGWQDSTYARGVLSGLSNYNYTHVGLNNSFDLTETSSASLVVNAGRLDSALYAFNTDNIDVQLQLQHAWSPRWSSSLSGGPSSVWTDGRRASGSVFSASVSRQGERFSIDTSLSRSIAPNGSGLQSRRDEVGLHAALSLSEHVGVAGNLSMIRSRDLLPQFNFTVSDVRYTRAELSLSWNFARDWNLGLVGGNSAQQILDDGPRGRNIDGRLLLSWRHHGPIG